MKIAGSIILAIGVLYSFGALMSGYNRPEGIFWIIIGGYLIWHANRKRQDEENKDKWLNGDS